MGRVEPLSDGYQGLQVVEALEKACQSIKDDGRPHVLAVTGG
jgi:hypothetical protein